MQMELITYLKNAIVKVEGGKASSEFGSHLVGIFAKSANGFEKELKRHIERRLQSAGINYELEIREVIKGPTFSKATLGNIIAAVKQASQLKPDFVPKLIPGKPSAFFHALQKLNEIWVQIKHGEEVDEHVLVLQMKSMLSLLQQINAAKPV